MNIRDREGLFNTLTAGFVFFFDVEGSLSEPLGSDCSNCSSSSSLSGFRLGMVGKILNRVAFHIQTRYSVSHAASCDARVSCAIARVSAFVLGCSPSTTLHTELIQGIISNIILLLIHQHYIFLGLALENEDST